MNSYFVSCEIAENPDLYGLKVAVAPSSSVRKSIILAASYEAKAEGVKAAMRISDALKLCPDLIIVDSNMALYASYSRAFFNYFLSITPLVEPGSIDEGYLDVTDVCKEIEPLTLANQIQQEMINRFRLPCSIGIAPNKNLAKMASEMKKPLGITVLRRREVPEKMWPLPVTALIGVGKKTLPLLQILKIKTIGDLANYKDIKFLRELLGDNNADSLQALACGLGDNDVNSERFTEVLSVSNSQTFDNDVYDVDEIKTMYKILTNTVCNRLSKNRNKALTFTMQLKYNTFQNITRSKTLDRPTNDEKIVYQLIEDIFDDIYQNELGVRLVGVGCSKLSDADEVAQQLSIFDNLSDHEKEHHLNSLIENINKQLGVHALKKGIDNSKEMFNRFEKPVIDKKNK